MVDADERGCWGLRSLTFPAAGDLTAVPAFLGLTVWRGRQVLNIITKAIGDCSYDESLGGEVEWTTG